MTDWHFLKVNKVQIYCTLIVRKAPWSLDLQAHDAGSDVLRKG